MRSNGTAIHTNRSSYGLLILIIVHLLDDVVRRIYAVGATPNKDWPPYVCQALTCFTMRDGQVKII